MCAKSGMHIYKIIIDGVVTVEELKKLLEEHFKSISQEQLLKNLKVLDIDKYFVDDEDAFQFNEVSVDCSNEKLEYQKCRKRQYVFSNEDNEYSNNLKIA